MNQSIEEKLSKVKYKSDNNSHLVVCQEDCKNCKNRTCEAVCPANVYSYDKESQTMHVAYENCLECGACRIVCDKKSLQWRYPQQGYGITYKLG